MRVQMANRSKKARLRRTGQEGHFAPCILEVCFAMFSCRYHEPASKSSSAEWR